MAIVRTMPATNYPQSGRLNLASPAIAFSDEQIDWPSVRADSNAAYTLFDYQNANGSVSPCRVKLAKSHVFTTFSVATGS